MEAKRDRQYLLLESGLIGSGHVGMEEELVEEAESRTSGGSTIR